MSSAVSGPTLGYSVGAPQGAQASSPFAGGVGDEGIGAGVEFVVVVDTVAVEIVRVDRSKVSPGRSTTTRISTSWEPAGTVIAAVDAAGRNVTSPTPSCASGVGPSALITTPCVGTTNVGTPSTPAVDVPAGGGLVVAVTVVVGSGGLAGRPAFGSAQVRPESGVVAGRRVDQLLA